MPIRATSQTPCNLHLNLILTKNADINHTDISQQIPHVQNCLQTERRCLHVASDGSLHFFLQSSVSRDSNSNQANNTLGHQLLVVCHCGNDKNGIQFYNVLPCAGSSPPSESSNFLCPLLSLSMLLPVDPQCHTLNNLLVFLLIHNATPLTIFWSSNWSYTLRYLPFCSANCPFIVFHLVCDVFN